MSKLLKGILTASLVICMTVCVGLFASACDEPDNNKYFTVTVVLPDNDNAPVQGAEVAICTMNGSILACLDTIVTGSDGVAKFNLTTPVDYSDTTQFLVKVHNVPAGYIYADGNGTEYDSDEGEIFDIVALNSSSVTITLTRKVTAVAADTVTEVSDNAICRFTATKAATYHFTVSNFDESWKLNEDAKDNNFASLNLKANETAEFIVDADCKVLVRDVADLNTMDSPADYTLGETENFNVMLVYGYDYGNYGMRMGWGTPDGNYSLVFTTEAAGKYRVTLTSSYSGDSVGVSLIPLESYELPTSVNNVDFSHVHANEQYRLQISGENNYTGLKAGDVIDYTVKLEYVGPDSEEGGDETNIPVNLILGENNIPSLTYGVMQATCTYNGTANAKYTVTVTLQATEWSVNNEIIMTQSTTVTADANGLVSFILAYAGFEDNSGAFTLTFALAQ